MINAWLDEHVEKRRNVAVDDLRRVGMSRWETSPWGAVFAVVAAAALISVATSTGVLLIGPLVVITLLAIIAMNVSTK